MCQNEMQENSCKSCNFYLSRNVTSQSVFSCLSRFIDKWGQVVLVSSRDLKSTFSLFGVKWGRISRLG